MKNQYFGDINDYRKYGLLRLLQSRSGLTLGICWMLTSDDNRSDGIRIGYLEQPAKWRERDPELFDALRESVWAGRHVRHVRERQIVRARYTHEDVLRDPVEDRERYFAQVAHRVRDADIVFFDPDNGVEVPSVPRGRRNSSKYIYWSELREAYEAGASVLVYQHFRRVERLAFTKDVATQVSVQLGASSVTTFRTGHVLFGLAPQVQHKAALDAASLAIGAQWYGEIIPQEFTFRVTPPPRSVAR